MKIRLAVRVLAACLLGLFALVAVAQERKDSFEISPFISLTDFATETRLDSNPGFGLRVGHNFTPWIGAELTWHRSANAEFTEIKTPTSDLEEIQAVVNFNWKRHGAKFATRFQPYLSLGMGYSDYSIPVGLNYRRADQLNRKEGLPKGLYNPEAAHIDSVGTAVFALGSRFYINESLAVRLDLRAVQAIATDFTNFVPSLGLSYMFGGTGSKDADGDGVVDYQDDCPGTPRGATVNRRGCPSDADGDKVFDGIDKCPDTPAGVVVDDKGCPVDSDGDGVPDGPDQCPDTPKGARVDEKGCPLDADGDGVADGIDECPDTPKGAKVDAKGCPIDTDGDGVPDGIDECAKTPKGAKVDARGCPVDTDGDGVFDGIDECPDTPPGTKVDKKGCPLIQPLFNEERKSLVLTGVNFDTDKAVLKPESAKALDEVAASLVAYPSVRVEVQGHTDSTGSSRHNQTLSQARSQAVVDYLASKGIAADRMVAKGYGKGKPIATNDTEEGRAQNRRVELQKID